MLLMSDSLYVEVVGCKRLYNDPAIYIMDSGRGYELYIPVNEWEAIKNEIDAKIKAAQPVSPD